MNRINFSSNSILRYLYILLVSGLFINCAYYTYINAIPLVRSDGWRFIGIYLQPWYEGVFNWRMLWGDHHPQPLTGLLYIANAEWFGLRMNYEALVTMPFSLLILAVIYSAMSRTVRDSSRWCFYGPVVIAAIVILSLVSTNVYTWSLVTKGFVTSFVAVWAINFLDRQQAEGLAHKTAVLLYLVFLVFLIVFSDNAIIFLIASILILTVNLLIYRKKKYIHVITILILAKISQMFFIAWVVAESHSRKTPSLELLTYFPEYISYMGVGLLSSWVNTSVIFKEFRYVVPYASAAMLVLYAVTLYIYITRGMSKITIIPGVFIIVACITAVAGALFRFNPELATEMSGHVPRYYLRYSLGTIGVVWVWFYHLAQWQGGKMMPRVVMTCASLLIISQITSSFIAWKTSPYLLRATKHNYSAMMKNSEGDFSVLPARYIIGNNSVEKYGQKLEFLRQHKLNIFLGDDFFEGFK